MRAFVFAELVNGHNVRVFKLRGRGGFGVEAVDEIASGSSAAGEEFERNDAVDAKLAGFEDDAAPAPAEFFEQFVIAEETSFGKGLDCCGRGGN